MSLILIIGKVLINMIIVMGIGFILIQLNHEYFILNK